MVLSTTACARTPAPATESPAQVKAVLPPADADAAAVALATAATVGAEAKPRVSPLSGAVDQGKAAVPFFDDAAVSGHGGVGVALLALAGDPPTEGLRDALMAAPEVAKAALCAALWHERAAVRAGSARMLGTVDGNDPAVRAALLRSLRQEPDRDVRAAVSASLIGQRVQELAPTLAEVLAGDDASRVRANAAWALGTSADAGTAAALVAAFGDRDATVRLAAVASLRRLRARETLEALERMTHDPDRRVQRAAQRAVDDLGGARALRNRGDAQ